SAGFSYRTTGEHLTDGGMGSVYFLERRRRGQDRQDSIEPVVGKIFHQNYLYQLRTDDVTRRDHQTTLSAMTQIAATEHPNLLPTYLAAPIADNHLFVTPRKAETLLEAVAKNELTTRRKVELLMQAIRALGSLHEQRIIHRDFTLRNILIEADARKAYLFDFDLSLSLDEIGPVTYRTHYRGRIFGSPGFSVAPESLDPALMESAITQRLDIFAIGAALHGLFTDETVYGNTQDMWGLLVSIADGVVVGGNSRIHYKETVPPLVRPVIERCLERDPGNRAGSVSSILSELDGILDRLDDGRRDGSTYHSTLSVRLQQSAMGDRLASVLETRTDTTVNGAVIQIADDALGRYGYQIDKSLGRVKGHPIFLASPRPELLAHGKFSDTNTFPKIVTAQNLNLAADPQAVLDAWFGHYLPILKNAREGRMTTLYRAVFDEESYHLLLFSEFVSDARFGPDLDPHELTLEEAFGLAYLATQQVARLHRQGLAHNNVRARSLLLKGLRDTRDVHPAMLGLVEPSISPESLVDDVRKLSGLVLGWIRPIRVEALDQRHRIRIDEIRAHLADLAFNDQVVPSGIDELIELLADALSVLNFNFGVLRENMGDLDDYALMLVSHPLYGRLWE
ncbi:MAG TPA: protein kinase, partial [Kofleriaceae bacterium]|nr:protein kinase [Kofleriaceae bacterium]